MASWKGPWNQYSSSDDDICSPDFMEGPKEPSETDTEEEHSENHEEDEEEEEDDDEDVDDSDGDDDDFDDSDNDDGGHKKPTVSGKKYPRQYNGAKVASKKKKE
ncbi:trigger factor-like [Triticum dicoccoides]|uniref:trigger factor-like n=1 Tax=Triticum dicoccoides TaxID=85692 RepID=UPI00189101B4|nr:trigger factor-like [Triticum dicoccoides]